MVVRPKSMTAKLKSMNISTPVKCWEYDFTLREYDLFACIYNNTSYNTYYIIIVDMVMQGFYDDFG